MLSSSLKQCIAGNAVRARARSGQPLLFSTWPPSCSRCSRSRSLAGSSRQARSTAAKASSDTQEASKKSVATMTIDDLDTQYCDDFECTSSPAVEQTVRTIARDLQRGTYSRSAFQPDFSYDDGFRSFKGTDKLGRAAWVRDVLKDSKAVVKKMRMSDKSTAHIEWQVSGQVAVFRVQVAIKTTLEMNLLTGRVTSLKESWDLAGLAAPASAALVAARVTWSAQQASKDAQDGLSRTIDSISSMSSVDEETVYRDPTDPTKFFRQEDSTMQDAISLALLLAVVYAAYKAYATLFGA